MLCFEIFRDIENLPKLWKFEGGFIVLALAIILVCTMLITFIPSWGIKAVLLLLAIIAIVILQTISDKHGIKGIKRLWGNKKQPDIIIVTNPRFFLEDRHKPELEKS